MCSWTWLIICWWLIAFIVQQRVTIWARWVFTFIIHRYIVSLSSSRSTFHHVSAARLFQSPGSCRQVGFRSGARCLGVWYYTVSASSSGPVLHASYFVRDSEQITASEALLVLHEGPRASESSLLAETIPETQDIPQTPDVTQSSDVSQDFEVIIPRRTKTADPRPDVA